MFISFIAAIALALAVPHAHGASPVFSVHVHASSFDGNGSGPPINPGP